MTETEIERRREREKDRERERETDKKTRLAGCTDNVSSAFSVRPQPTSDARECTAPAHLVQPPDESPQCARYSRRVEVKLGAVQSAASRAAGQRVDERGVPFAQRLRRPYQRGVPFACRRAHASPRRGRAAREARRRCRSRRLEPVLQSGSDSRLGLRGPTTPGWGAHGSQLGES